MDEEVWLDEWPVDTGPNLRFADNHSVYVATMIYLIRRFRQLKFDQLCMACLNYASRMAAMHYSLIASQLSTCIEERVSTGTEGKERLLLNLFCQGVDLRECANIPARVCSVFTEQADNLSQSSST